MNKKENNYQRLKSIENEIILLISKESSAPLKEDIQQLKTVINEVLENIGENRSEDMEDRLKFLYGYDSNEIIIRSRKKIEEFKKKIKDGEVM